MFQAPRALTLALSLCACLAGFTPASWGEPLQGRVEEAGVEPSRDVIKKTIEAMPTPVLKPRPAQTDKAAPLKGTIKQDGLSGSAEDWEDEPLKPMQGKADQRTLKGAAIKDDSGLQGMDPDADNRELMIEWDKWRNRLLFAIQSGMQEYMNNPNELSEAKWDPHRQVMVRGPKFPMGTIAWFYCQVTPDRRIVNLKLTRSSGHKDYDKALIESINNLNGSSILRYPRGSKRTIVSQDAGIKTAETSEYRYFKFGDVERQRF